jgi:hypothetical protein
MQDADPKIHYCLKAKNNIFSQLFIAPGPAIQAFNLCGPFIVLDGTFWKNCWDIMLLIVVTLDANHEIYPLAYGVMPSESDNHWSWFLKQFVNAYPSAN